MVPETDDEITQSGIDKERFKCHRIIGLYKLAEHKNDQELFDWATCALNIRRVDYQVPYVQKCDRSWYLIHPAEMQDVLAH